MMGRCYYYFPLHELLLDTSTIYNNSQIASVFNWMLCEDMERGEWISLKKLTLGEKGLQNGTMLIYLEGFWGSMDVIFSMH